MFDKIKRIYTEWRWGVYNHVDYYTITTILKKEKITDYDRLILNSNNISEKRVKAFRKGIYSVSEKEIIEFDKSQIEKNYRILIKGNIRINPLRSPFIEGCLIDISNYSYNDLLLKIRENIKYYFWWDILQYEEIIWTLIQIQFLYSTKKLIGTNEIINFFHVEYPEKELLVMAIINKINPDINTIERMNDISSRDNMFNYNWLFNNDIKRAVRLIENECRIFNKQKIIGAYYNEDILFKEIQRLFGESYIIVSQGSPEWLRPQRFDIYFPEIKLAIEYQGEQHFAPVDFGGKGEQVARQQFELNKKRDVQKLEKSKENNCIMIYIKPGYDMKSVIRQIERAISKQVLRK